MSNEVKFEGKERRIAGITACMAEYGIKDLEEARQICLDKGVDPDEIVKGIQPIAFENAAWAYTLGCALAIKKGVKIITTAGVYGVVESIEETTDGKVVTIVTGNSKNPTTMTIHINAIMGIDNKKNVDDKDVTVEETKVEEVKEDDKSVANEEPKKTSKKSSSQTTKKAE